MISIQRLEEPDILKTKKAEWDRAYRDRRAKNPNAKPSSSQYAHGEIKRCLQAMSHHKCFYCEQSVKGHGQVDHYIEVAERPDLAHDWNNLYLSCRLCNGKMPNLKLPAKNSIDPCDLTVNPQEHLAFDKELIKARNNSTSGDQTIRKYQLNRMELDYERLKRLNYFDELYRGILLEMTREGRQTMRSDECELLRRFAQPDAPFSLMFRYYLARLGL